MAPADIEDVQESVRSLKREVEELREIMQLSNREELVRAARKARSGEGSWTRLDDTKGSLLQVL